MNLRLISLTLTLIFLSGCQSIPMKADNISVPGLSQKYPSKNSFKRPKTAVKIPEWSRVELIDMMDITTIDELEPEQNDPEVLSRIDQINFSPLQAYKDGPNVKLDAADYEYRHIPTILPQDLWFEMRKGFKLDLDIDESRLDSQYNWYARHQAYMDRVAKRASRYMFYVVEEIKKRDMPAEIALLPIVESAFDPFAYSHGRASGMWQFIPSTGRIYGLNQDWWYDGRRDVTASTDAALDFLESLAKRFDGDWLLALAAYNSGGGTVSKAIRKNKAKGLPTDFWSLSLPKETSAYVPKLLALAKIIWNPAEANISLTSISTEPYFEKVATQSQIDLAQAAELADVPLDEIYLLNPGFNQWATSPDGPHYLLLPMGKGSQFKKELAKIPSNQRISWQRYTIQSGDSLSTISAKFNTTQQVIRDVNNLRSSTIVAGKTLLIPSASRKSKDYALSAGQRLAKRQSINPNASNLSRTTYIVKPGDSLWDISQKYNVNLRALAKWNGMAPTDLLRMGQQLVIWLPRNSAQLTQTQLADSRAIIRKVGYTIRQGDSLNLIANKFNVSVGEINKWNTLSGKYIQPGQYLTLYVDVTRIQ